MTVLASEWGYASATVAAPEPPPSTVGASGWGTASAVIGQEAPAVVGASPWGTASGAVAAQTPTDLTDSGVVVWDGTSWQPATPVHWSSGQWTT